jgi:hypothetical protein
MPPMPKSVLVWVLDVCGVILLTGAAWIVTPAAGLAVLGVGCIGLSASLDLPSRKAKRS